MFFDLSGDLPSDGHELLMRLEAQALTTVATPAEVGIPSIVSGAGYSKARHFPEAQQCRAYICAGVPLPGPLACSRACKLAAAVSHTGSCSCEGVANYTDQMLCARSFFRQPLFVDCHSPGRRGSELSPSLADT